MIPDVHRVTLLARCRSLACGGRTIGEELDSRADSVSRETHEPCRRQILEPLGLGVEPTRAHSVRHCRTLATDATREAGPQGVPGPGRR